MEWQLLCSNFSQALDVLSTIQNVLNIVAAAVFTRALKEVWTNRMNSINSLKTYNNSNPSNHSNTSGHSNNRRCVNDRNNNVSNSSCSNSSNNI